MKSINSVQIKHFVNTRIEQARNQARIYRQEMARAESPTVVMAAVMAVGTLIGTIPVPMLDMATAAFVMRRYSSMPRAPFFVGMALANNLVMAPLYATTPKVGGAALGWVATHSPVVAPDVFMLKIVVGYLLIALGLALGCFLLAHTGFYGYRLTRRAQTA
jgi:hypothetical protein